ncbi:MAG: hypothetical protein ACR2JB_16635 [Bryobacteraceae bacterium]
MIADPKEFLVSKIDNEVKREGVALSEVERKMLYFSEAYSSLPDSAEINEAFDREYDQAEYEKKIVKLIRNVRAAERPNRGETRAWEDAVRRLRTGDHYLLVMVDEACRRGRPRGDFIKLVGTAILVLCILLVLAFFVAHR